MKRHNDSELMWRGKNRTTGEWLYSNWLQTEMDDYSIGSRVPYTDKEGHDVYVGDLVRFDRSAAMGNEQTPLICEVCWTTEEPECYELHGKDGHTYNIDCVVRGRVIGNIHDDTDQ